MPFHHAQLGATVAPCECDVPRKRPRLENLASSQTTRKKDRRHARNIRTVHRRCGELPGTSHTVSAIAPISYHADSQLSLATAAMRTLRRHSLRSLRCDPEAVSRAMLLLIAAADQGDGYTFRIHNAPEGQHMKGGRVVFNISLRGPSFESRQGSATNLFAVAALTNLRALPS